MIGKWVEEIFKESTYHQTYRLKQETGGITSRSTKWNTDLNFDIEFNNNELVSILRNHRDRSARNFKEEQKIGYNYPFKGKFEF